VSPQFDHMCTAGNRQVRRNRHVAAVPRMSDASTSVRIMPSRQAKFPPLQFVSEGVRTAVNPHRPITRSRVSRNVQLSCGDSHTCLQSNCDHSVAEREHVEEEVQAETARDLQLTVEHRMPNALAVACVQPPAAVDCMTSCSDTLTSPQCLQSACTKMVNDPAASNHMTDETTLQVTDKNTMVAERAFYSAASQEQNSATHAENISAVNFDIDTPTGEVEPSDCSDDPDPKKVAGEEESDPEACQNMADESSIEPVRVLCFSYADRSLYATYDPAEHAICAAELNEHMSEVLDGEEEMSRNKLLNSHHSLCHNAPEVFSMLNTLTPFENHFENTVLVSDTPVSDYDLSYRQRALKAANIRLRHRTHKF